MHSTASRRSGRRRLGLFWIFLSFPCPFGQLAKLSQSSLVSVDKHELPTAALLLWQCVCVCVCVSVCSRIPSIHAYVSVQTHTTSLTAESDCSWNFFQPTCLRGLEVLALSCFAVILPFASLFSRPTHIILPAHPLFSHRRKRALSIGSGRLILIKQI